MNYSGCKFVKSVLKTDTTETKQNTLSQIGFCDNRDRVSFFSSRSHQRGKEQLELVRQQIIFFGSKGYLTLQLITPANQASGSTLGHNQNLRGVELKFSQPTNYQTILLPKKMKNGQTNAPCSLAGLSNVESIGGISGDVFSFSLFDLHFHLFLRLTASRNTVGRVIGYMDMMEHSKVSLRDSNR